MILFLGGGFIANALSAKFEEARIEHRIVSRRSEPEAPRRNAADINSLTESSPVFDGVDTVIYFAHSSVPYSSMQNIREDAEQNISTAISLFEILSNKKIRVIYISSGGSIYGDQAGPITEASLPSPVSAYGVAKYTIENYLKLFHHNYQLPFDILRLSNIYGVGHSSNKPQGIMGALARAFIERQRFAIWGDGSAEKDYLYIDDAVDALAKVAAAVPSNDIFNVAYGSSVSVREILSLFEKYFGYKIDIETRPPFDFDVSRVFLDNSKFREAYDWKPKIDVETGIGKTAEWLIGSGTASIPGSQP
ncbi:MAG: NAD-dependent epimerase/dehydratase family protein [Acidobacteriota bacterium]